MIVLVKVSGSLAMIGSVLPRLQCNIERISPERTGRYCHSGSAGEQIEGYCHRGSAISRGYRRKSRVVPRGYARTSRPPASSSRTDAPKFFVLAGARAPAHEIGANTNLKINKDCSKNYYFFLFTGSSGCCYFSINGWR